MSIHLLFDNFPQLENDIMYTKMIDHDDDDQMIAIMTNPNCFRFTKGEAKTKKVAIQLVDHYIGEYHKRNNVHVGIYLKYNHKLIGIVSIFNIRRREETVEIGYRFDEAFWHHGYAEMACRLVIQYLMKRIRVNKIYATTMINDHTSNHLLRQCGFILVRAIKDAYHWKEEPTDLYVYVLNR